MNRRAVGIFAVLAILVVAGALWISTHRLLPQAALSGALVLPDFGASLNEVNQIRIARGDGTVTTLKRLDSTEWQVVERAYRADLVKLRRLLLDVAALAVVEEKTRDPANYAGLGLDEPDYAEARGTLLEISSPKRTRRLIIGRTVGSKTGFVRVADQAGSSLAAPQLSLDAQPGSWLDHQLFDLPPERIKSITRKPPSARSKSLPPGEDPSFAAFSFEDVRPAAPPAASTPQLIIETKDGMIVELSALPAEALTARRWISVAARALESAEPKIHREASDLAARTTNRRFQLPEWRYAALFPAPMPSVKSKGKPFSALAPEAGR